MKKTNPTLYEELTLPNRQKVPDASEPQPEDKGGDAGDEDADECNLTIPSVALAMTQQIVPAGMGVCDSGVLISTAEAERVDSEVEPPTNVEGEKTSEGDEAQSSGRGKRRKFPNKLYSASSFWRHNDNEDSDAEI